MDIKTCTYDGEGDMKLALERTNEHLIKRAVTAELYQAYISYLDASPRTAEAYKANIRQFVKWLNANGISQPQRADVIRYRDELKERCKPSTVQAYITALRLFFRWTSQADLYPNIADHVKGAKLDNSHKKDYLTATQVKHLLASIDVSSMKGRRDYALIALMVTGGLRDIEASRANTEDLRPLAGGTVLYLQGKGREERTEFTHVVPVIENALRDYLKKRQRVQPGEPLFASLGNNSKEQRLTPRSISAIVKQRLTAAGYDSDRLTAHSLRHTAVTLSLMGGQSLQEVQQFARHQSISTTQIYAHNLDRAKNKCAETIAGAIFTSK